MFGECRMDKSYKKRIADALLGLTITVTVVCMAVSITVMFKPLYYFDIGHLNIAEKSGYTQEQCVRNYDILIDYNLIGGPDKLEFADMGMSEQGRIHFEEVKAIFTAAQWIGAAGTAAVILLLCRRRDPHWLKASVMSASAICAAVLTAIIVDWRRTFAAMHEIFFRNDYWIFNPDTDPIIRLLPNMFFMHCGIMIIGIVLLINIIFWIIYRKRTKWKIQDSKRRFSGSTTEK